MVSSQDNRTACIVLVHENSHRACTLQVQPKQLDSAAQEMLLPCAQLDSILAGCRPCGLMYVSPAASASAFMHAQVCVDQYVQFVWFPIKLAGYTCMILVRFDVILGNRVTKARTDVLCMLVALSVSIGLAVPLAKVYHLDYVPPLAVATAGIVYLAMHFLGRLTQREQQPQASKRYCACGPHPCMLACCIMCSLSHPCRQNTVCHALPQQVELAKLIACIRSLCSNCADWQDLARRLLIKV